MIFINDMLYASKSFKIKQVVTSSYKAELLALFAGIKHCRTTIPIIKELGFNITDINIYCDNKSLVTTVNGRLNAENLERAFLNAMNYSREAVTSKKYNLQHITGQSNPADILTKRMHGSRIRELMKTTLIAKAFDFNLETYKQKQTKSSTRQKT
ncbi:unnamed protein product [Ambrosiozyma monospora]|uniref:Unnamed protein product n=1 Tax=Ambrosiozyma monospora TaxID=43982 RepID=A0A9W6YU29_AMBMO|nr:unnamed protein product [Ambrosiozyma monospora]